MSFFYSVVGVEAYLIVLCIEATVMEFEAEYWNLIGKYLKGNLSDQERNALNEWLHETPENSTLFDQVKKLWFSLDKDNGYEPDVERNWLKFRKAIEEENFSTKITAIEESVPFVREKPEKKVVKLAAWPLLLRIAAVLIVGVFLVVMTRELLSEQQLITVKTERKEVREIMLPDSSKVYLNENSIISYNEDFNLQNRVVNLKGEAYFEVRKAEGYRFIVFAGDSKTEVLGTSFTVVALEGAEQVSVKVLSGSVAFSLKDESNTVFLIPGSAGVLDVQEQEVNEEEIEDPNFLSWKTKTLEFDNTEFKKVVSTLEAYFDADVRVESEPLWDCRYSGTFIQPDIESLLEVLSATMNVTYREKDGAYIIAGPGCN